MRVMWTWPLGLSAFEIPNLALASDLHVSEVKCSLHNARRLTLGIQNTTIGPQC